MLRRERKTAEDQLARCQQRAGWGGVHRVRVGPTFILAEMAAERGPGKASTERAAGTGTEPRPAMEVGRKLQILLNAPSMPDDVGQELPARDGLLPTPCCHDM